MEIFSGLPKGDLDIILHSQTIFFVQIWAATYLINGDVLTMRLIISTLG